MISGGEGEKCLYCTGKANKGTQSARRCTVSARVNVRGYRVRPHPRYECVRASFSEIPQCREPLGGAGKLHSLSPWQLVVEYLANDCK